METLIAAAYIVLQGGAWFRAIGTEKSAGSKILVSAVIAVTGIYEYPFGVSIQQVLDDCGAQNVQAVQMGGPSGTLVGRTILTAGPALRAIHRRFILSLWTTAQSVAINRNFARFLRMKVVVLHPCRVAPTAQNNLDKIADGGAHRRIWLR